MLSIFQKSTVQSLPTTHLAITFSDKPQRINNSSSLEQRITQTLTSDHLTQKALKILHIYTQKECKKITHKTVQELTAMFKQDLSHFTDDLLEDTTLPEQIAYELFDIYSRANKNRWNKNSYKQYYQKVSDTLEERKKLQFQEAKLLKDKQQQEGLNLYNQQLKQKQVETSQQLLQRFDCEASINNQIIEQSVRNNKLLDHQLLPEILPNLIASHAKVSGLLPKFEQTARAQALGLPETSLFPDLKLPANYFFAIIENPTTDQVSKFIAQQGLESISKSTDSTEQLFAHHAQQLYTVLMQHNYCQGNFSFPKNPELSHELEALEKKYQKFYDPEEEEDIISQRYQAIQETIQNP
jgi:hypothetical protein